MKKLFCIGFGLMMITQCFAAHPLFPMLKNHETSSLKKSTVQKGSLTHDDYADFSGNWAGTCDNFPNEEQRLLIEQDPEARFISINHQTIPLDAISMGGEEQHNSDFVFITERRATHFRWSEDGQQILAAGISYMKEGSMSEGGFQSSILKMRAFLEQKQLVMMYDIVVYQDGDLQQNYAVKCIYQNSK